MRNWNLQRAIILCSLAEVLKGKNSQGKSIENTCFPILVDAICHLFAGMCPPIVDMGSLPPCDPLLGLKAYSPQWRTQYTIPHWATLHELGKSACSCSVFLNNLTKSVTILYFFLLDFGFLSVCRSQVINLASMYIGIYRNCILNMSDTEDAEYE